MMSERGRMDKQGLTRALAAAGLSTVCLMAALAGCGGSSNKATPTTTAPTTLSPTTTLTSAANTASTPSATARSVTSTVGASSTASTAPSQAQNLPVTAAIKTALVAAFASYDHIPEQDVSGLRSGSVYYAYQPSTGTHWALATVDPISTAPVSVLVKFQDGVDRAIFAERPGAGWSVVNLVGEHPCLTRQGLPSAIESLWGMTGPSRCQTSPGPSPGAATVDTSIKVYGDCQTPTVEPDEIVLDLRRLRMGTH